VVAVADKDGESEEGVDSYIEETSPATIKKVISFDIYIFRERPEIFFNGDTAHCGEDGDSGDGNQ